jgi:hypothetical protein
MKSTALFTASLLSLAGAVKLVPREVSETLGLQERHDANPTAQSLHS